jgi:ZIP family zinc transporter
MSKHISAVGVAFGLSFAAAIATCLGGTIIFSSRLIKLASPTNLSISIAISAGVMLFISLVEMFGESIEQFKIAGGISNQEKRNHETECDATCSGNAMMYTNLSFIAGACIIFLLDWLIHRLAPSFEHNINPMEFSDLERNEDDTNVGTTKEAIFLDDVHVSKQQINRTGILTALALAIHNLPEGVATYTSAIGNLKVGFVLTLGILVHNIPEGIAVAIPIYYATSSRTKAFMWVCGSSLAEPFGAFLAWLILGEGLNPTIEGILFGIVAGMMVTLSTKELIPAAVKLCPDGHCVSLAILLGMGIMSSSFLLFAYVGL